MSVEDFCRCTPSEFYTIHKHWAEHQQRAERTAWEQTRVMAMFQIQPYVKGKADPQKILPFPWDNETNNTDKQPREELSREETQARFRAAIERYGLT